MAKDSHHASVRTHDVQPNAFTINLNDDCITPPVEIVQEEDPLLGKDEGGKYELIKKKLLRRADGHYNFDSHKGFF